MNELELFDLARFELPSGQQPKSSVPVVTAYWLIIVSREQTINQ